MLCVVVLDGRDDGAALSCGFLVLECLVVACVVSRRHVFSIWCCGVHADAQRDVHERSFYCQILRVFKQFELRLCVCVERVSGDQCYGCSRFCVSIFRRGHCDVLRDVVLDRRDVTTSVPRGLRVSIARSGACTVSSRHVFGIRCFGMHGGTHGNVHGGSVHDHVLRVFEQWRLRKLVCLA